MQKIRALTAALFFIPFLVSNCSKDKDGSTDTSQTAQYLSQGQWSVEYYFDQTDETSDFKDVLFTFHPDGVVSSNTGSGGSWQVIMDDGKRKLLINIATNSVLQQLNDDWVIASSTASTIQLKEDNASKHEVRLRRL